ncbi:cytochrome P450 [Xylariaceae sp. FL0594]|nr:cytochrome P450 [Xylariaceae sp. FL0594]
MDTLTAHPPTIPLVTNSWFSLDFLKKVDPVSATIHRGYELVNKALKLPFRMIYWRQEYVILPAKYMRDLKTAHRDHLSFFETVQDVFFLRSFVGDLFQSDRQVCTVKKGLNPHLNDATDISISEMDHAFTEELGSCESWTSIPVLTTFCGIAHRVASRVIVGEEVCRNPLFKKASHDYFSGHVDLGCILLWVPWNSLRAILAPVLSFLQRSRQRRVLGMVASVMKKRHEAKTTTTSVTSEARTDCIEWTLRFEDQFPLSKTEDPFWQMSHELIHLLGAAHAPTGMILTQMFWHLFGNPQYLEPLREEAERAIGEFGMTTKIVNHLPLQDSFIRETNRMYKNNKLGITRRVMDEPFTFHDGLTLPVGTRVAFPVDEYTRDPDTFPDPDKFDGYRYIRFTESDTRTEDGVNQWNASHAHQLNLTFGYGAHVCPGRFFAVRLIKIIFTKLLTEYDFRSEWKGDGMPPGFQFEGSEVPNIKARISFRKRSSPRR